MGQGPGGWGEEVREKTRSYEGATLSVRSG